MIAESEGINAPENHNAEYVVHNLSKLPDNQREAIVLKIYEEMSFREIAEMQEQSVNTVASWYRRGLEALRKFMEDPI